MALQTIVGGVHLFPLPDNASGAPGISNNASLAMASASQQCAFIFTATRTGNIRTPGFYVNSVTSAPTAAHDVRMETVDASTGLNTGSLVSTNSNGSITLNTTGWKTVTLTADAVVTAGTAYALVFVAPGANQGSIRLGSFGNDFTDFPYLRTVSAGKAAGAPIMALEYDDGVVSHVPGAWPISAITSPGAYGSGTNPNKRGIRFRVPFTGRLAGCEAWGDYDGDFDFVLYTGGTSASTLLSVDKDLRGTTTGTNPYKFEFTTKPTISANTFYRLALVPTSATVIESYGLTVNAAKYMDGLAGGQDVHYTTVNGTPSAEGDWTNTTTIRLCIALRFDKLDDGVQLGGESAYTSVG